MTFYGLGALFGHLLYICSQGSSMLDLLLYLGVVFLVTVAFLLTVWLIELLFVRRY